MIESFFFLRYMRSFFSHLIMIIKNYQYALGVNTWPSESIEAESQSSVTILNKHVTEFLKKILQTSHPTQMLWLKRNYLIIITRLCYRYIAQDINTVTLYNQSNYECRVRMYIWRPQKSLEVYSNMSIVLRLKCRNIC